MVSMGLVTYRIYRALTQAFSPLLYLHLRYLRRLEHPTRWPERFGTPSTTTTTTTKTLIWFHAVSLGEGMSAIPIIRHCLHRRPDDLSVLMTTTTTSAFEVIGGQLPSGVIHQFAPLDVPAAVDAFLGYWKPRAIFLMESELWPNLIMSASEKGIVLALLNARISAKSFGRWSGPLALPLISSMLSKFSLISPLSTAEAIRFQLLCAPPFVINFAGDLKYVTGDFELSDKDKRVIEDLQLRLAGRPVWMAASIHKDEEEVVLWVHRVLMQTYPNLVTVVVPRHPHKGKQIALALRSQGLNVALKSNHETISSSTNFYVADTLGELRLLYRTTPIAVIGGSFLPNMAGHNISEAAAAGCAVLTGPYVGHFSHMIQEMQRLNPLSVRQVSGNVELAEALIELFDNSKILEARQEAAKEACLTQSRGVVEKVWDLINSHVLKQT
ncbi:hypothetical protein QJS04_geneDACA010064 [Acorus gramineus]|uniref:lipid IVA 3-deoxy-D-manno-octulosonic acid transferase n=1 Tax=Acorus gramineus TaxID=55184 RepID=A0AAV9BJ53_ACOGR|nr:hypothetical protein QJS04_geneDACA010064 [Acorus gramineus]